MTDNDFIEYDSESAYDLLRTELKRLHREAQKDYDAIARIMTAMDRAHREFKFACGRGAGMPGDITNLSTGTREAAMALYMN
jgi:hypothetical protein